MIVWYVSGWDNAQGQLDAQGKILNSDTANAAFEKKLAEIKNLPEVEESKKACKARLYDPEGKILRQNLAANYNFKPPGLKWMVVGSLKPQTGTEISNEALATALQQKVEFSYEEFDKFKVGELFEDSFIMVEGKYFASAGAEPGAPSSDKKDSDWVHSSFICEDPSCGYLDDSAEFELDIDDLSMLGMVWCRKCCREHKLSVADFKLNAWRVANIPPPASYKTSDSGPCEKHIHAGTACPGWNFEEGFCNKHRSTILEIKTVLSKHSLRSLSSLRGSFE